MLAALGALGAALTFGPEASAADTYDGSTFLQLSRQAVNVVRVQQYLTQYQLNADDTPTYFFMNARSAPARFVFPDKGTVGGGITRLMLGFGTGFGRPSTGSALSFGLQVDGAYATTFPAFFARAKGLDANAAQGLFYATASSHGLSFTGGVLLASVNGVDQTGSFQRPDGNREATFRMGTPLAVRERGKENVTASTQTILSLRHAEGAGLGVSFGQVPTQSETGALVRRQVLTALRGEIAPERLLREYGLFRAGIDRIAGEVDYYAESFEAGRKALQTSTPAAPRIERPIYELPLGVDNALGVGIRARAVTQVSPTPLFRLAELGIVYTKDVSPQLAFDAGGRGITFRRNERMVPSVDVFAGLRLFGRRASWTFSYSYNSPDTTTFFSLANAHVLGFQVVYGPLEVAPPLVPILGRDGRGKDGSRDNRSKDAAGDSSGGAT